MDIGGNTHKICELDDEALCCEEHPRRAGNLCVKPYGHPMPHIDGEDNEWFGRNL